MKKNEVTIGGVYKAKVTNKVVDVRIDRENAAGGWDATNLATKKKITIKSAQRLRRPVNDAAKAKRETTKKPADAKTAKARKDAIKEIDERLSGGDTAATAPAEAKDKPKATTDHTKRPNARASAKPGVKRMSLLDAAAEILAKSNKPMNARQMVDAAIEKKLWTPGAGKTPHATLYAAIIREMAKKGDAARFEKVDRGLFQRKGA